MDRTGSRRNHANELMGIGPGNTLQFHLHCYLVLCPLLERDKQSIFVSAACMYHRSTQDFEGLGRTFRLWWRQLGVGGVPAPRPQGLGRRTFRHGNCLRCFSFRWTALLNVFFCLICRARVRPIASYCFPPVNGFIRFAAWRHDGALASKGVVPAKEPQVQIPQPRIPRVLDYERRRTRSPSDLIPMKAPVYGLNDAAREYTTNGMLSAAVNDANAPSSPDASRLSQLSLTTKLTGGHHTLLPALSLSAPSLRLQWHPVWGLYSTFASSQPHIRWRDVLPSARSVIRGVIQPALDAPSRITHRAAICVFHF